MKAENMVRIGTVTDVSGRRARVKYQDTGITSGWLCVLQRTPGLSIATEQGHRHAGSSATAWKPAINDTVLVLYLPVDDGDGIILGGLQ